ncbi:MAG: HEAT repeat domain-containing protein [Gemmatimonadaceae bacterium]
MSIALLAGRAGAQGTPSECACADIPPFVRDSGARALPLGARAAAFDSIAVGSCHGAAVSVRSLAKLRDVLVAPRLEAALRSPSCRVRTAAAETLGDLMAPSSVSPLIVAMSDADPRVRAGAAMSLGRLRSTLAAPALTRALRDDDKHVRQAAAEALGKLSRP